MALLGRKKRSTEETQGGRRYDQMPQTGRAIPTGMKADREKFQCSTVFFARTYCSLCRANHEWFAREAWLCEPSEIAEMLH
jgi:hypothetical protein